MVVLNLGKILTLFTSYDGEWFEVSSTFGEPEDEI
jgi:hypothetical protein